MCNLKDSLLSPVVHVEYIFFFVFHMCVCVLCYIFCFVLGSTVVLDGGGCPRAYDNSEPKERFAAFVRCLHFSIDIRTLLYNETLMNF